MTRLNDRDTRRLTEEVGVGMAIAKRLFADLAERTADGGGVTRASYGEGEQLAHDLFAACAKEIGLEVTSDLNYDAQLVDRNGKKVFADAALEAKPDQWKLAFRAGKPATEAARAFAQRWLSDLQSQGVK